jgi:hypothetical protein
MTVINDVWYWVEIYCSDSYAVCEMLGDELYDVLGWGGGTDIFEMSVDVKVNTPEGVRFLVNKVQTNMLGKIHIRKFIDWEEVGDSKECERVFLQD